MVYHKGFDKLFVLFLSFWQISAENVRKLPILLVQTPLLFAKSIRHQSYQQTCNLFVYLVLVQPNLILSLIFYFLESTF